MVRTVAEFPHEVKARLLLETAENEVRVGGLQATDVARELVATAAVHAQLAIAQELRLQRGVGPVHQEAAPDLTPEQAERVAVFGLDVPDVDESVAVMEEHYREDSSVEEHLR